MYDFPRASNILMGFLCNNGTGMKRRMYYRNTEAVYTLSSILLNPLIEYKTFGGTVYATAPGKEILNAPIFDSITKDFWIVLRESSLLFSIQERRRFVINSFTAMLGFDETDEGSFNFYVNCDEEELTVNLI